MRPDQRLRKRSEFQSVYNAGVRVPGRHVVVFGLPRVDGRCRLGITATRKIGSAVVRNRARRRIRELFRRQIVLHAFEGDVVVNVRRSCAEVGWHELEQDFSQCVAKLLSRVGQGASPSGS